MSSKPGRELLDWKSTPQRLLTKTTIQICAEVGWGMFPWKRPKTLLLPSSEEFKAKLEEHVHHILPEIGSYFPRLPNRNQIYNRAYSMVISPKHSPTENAYVNRFTIPYVPLALRLVQRQEPFPEEDLMNELERITSNHVVLPHVVQEGPSTKRKTPKAETIRDHFHVIETIHGGRCPWCDEVKIVENGKKLPGCEIDHYHNVNWAGFLSIWPLCRSCHVKTFTEEGRHDSIAPFWHYIFNARKQFKEKYS